MRQRRLKLRDKQGELSYGTYEYSLEEWICDRIPPVPSGTLCEAQRCIQLRECGDSLEFNGLNEFCVEDYDHEGDCVFGGLPEPKHLAESYLYVLKDDHVCYTYVCDECCESRIEDYDGVDPGD